MDFALPSLGRRLFEDMRFRSVCSRYPRRGYEYRIVSLYVSDLLNVTISSTVNRTLGLFHHQARRRDQAGRLPESARPGRTPPA